MGRYGSEKKKNEYPISNVQEEIEYPIEKIFIALTFMSGIKNQSFIYRDLSQLNRK